MFNFSEPKTSCVSVNRSIQERELLQLLAEGDRNAFRQLYDLYRDKVFFYTLRFTESRQLAEDVLQDVFIKLWQHRETVAELRSLDAWLFTLAKNQLTNGFRRALLERSILAGIRESSSEVIDPVTQTVDFNEANRILHAAMEQLPPQQKMVYYLRRIHGLKISEIAAQLNISPLTVKKHISQASRSLRLLLEKQIELTGLMVIALVKALIHLF